MSALHRRLGPGPLGVILVVGAAGAALVLGLVLGSILLPTPGPAAVAGALPAARSLSGSEAVVVLTGDLEAHHVLDRLSVDEYNEDTSPGDPIDVVLTFRGAAAGLRIRTEAATLDTPVGARAVVSLGADTFYLDPEDCTIELASIEYVVVQPSAVAIGPPQGRPIPAYTGLLSCADVDDFRGNVTVTIQAVFQYRPDQSPLS